jgi:hypothetical protein
MLDQFLATVYRHDTEKTASAALEAKLRTMPTALVEKIASGLAPKCSDGSGDVKCWLDNFKGTPLFDKAVELERADLQLEQAELEQRMNNQAQDTWTKRDALRLQKRMLELDLAMEGMGADVGAAEIEVAPEEAEEAAIGTLEQVQAAEAAAGEGNKPEEKMENDAIAELHAAHGEGPQAPPAQAPKAEAAPPPPPPPQGQEGPAAGGQQPPPPKAPPKPPVKKEPPKEEAPPAEDVKQASIKVAATKAAARLLAKTAAENPEGHHLRRAVLGTPVSAAIEAESGSKAKAFGNTFYHGVSEQLKGLGNGAVGGGVLGGAAGAIHGGLTGGASKALSHGLAGAGAGAALGGYGGAAYGALKGQHGAEASRLHGEHSKHRPEAVARERSARDAEVVAEQEGMAPEQIANEAQGYRETADDIDARPGTYRARRALLGAGAGAATGAALGGALGGKAGMGALIGAGAGGLMGALPRPSGAEFRGDASALETHLAKNKTAGISVGGLVGAAKAAVPAIAGAAKAGGSMLGTAMKAGGLPQVAKSVGNVAAGFAKANPLAAAGAAGAAGIAAGRLSKGNGQPQA